MPKDMKHKEMKHKGGNPWLAHVKSVKAKHPGKSLKDILIMAKSSYKK